MDHMHPHRLLEGAYCRYPYSELLRRFRDTDLVVIDLDGCIFPGFSQTFLGRLIFFQIVFSPFSRRDTRFLPQLLLGSLFILRTRIKKGLGKKTNNLVMMQRYQDAMRGIPYKYLETLTSRVPGKSYSRSLDTINMLSNKAPVGIISFSLDIILRAYQPHANIAFFDANTTKFAASDGNYVFLGYESTALKTNSLDKARVMERYLKAYKAECPMVIGHNEDDTHMVRLVQNMQGISLGYNPSPDLIDLFDVNVKANNWDPIFTLFSNLMKRV
jgi:hypothetical protein